MANYISFKKLRVNVRISFCSEPFDWSLNASCKKLKPILQFDMKKKEWFVNLRLDEYHYKLDNIDNYKEVLTHFDETNRKRFLNFMMAKNKAHYEQEALEEKEKQIRLQKFEEQIGNYPKLYNHQTEAIRMLSVRPSQIVADDMGLGKTRSTIVFSEIQGYNKVLIICPASVKLNWRKEIYLVNKEAKVCILPSEVIPEDTKYFIINYDMLIKEIEFVKNSITKDEEMHIKEESFLNGLNFDLALIDESHYIKNDSKRSKVVLALTDSIKNVVPITGTPIKSRTRDIFNLLLAIRHPLITDGFFEFGRRYCGGIKTRFGWDFSGSSNLQELHENLKPYMIRRKKSDCLDLPDKLITDVYFELPREYKVKYANAFREYYEYVKKNLEGGDVIKKKLTLKNLEHTEHLVRLNLLKQLCAKAKLEMSLERIQDMLDEDEDRKIIIFSQYNEIINTLSTKFNKISVKLTGDTSIVNRQKVVDEFQTNPKVRVFISNLIAGGVGITLTKADVVIFMDLGWAPSDHSQAEDRAYRIGQEKTVNIYYFLTKDTLEEDIYELLRAKRNIANQIMDNEEYVDENIKVNILGELITKLNLRNFQ